MILCVEDDCPVVAILEVHHANDASTVHDGWSTLVSESSPGQVGAGGEGQGAREGNGVLVSIYAKDDGCHVLIARDTYRREVISWVIYSTKLLNIMKFFDSLTT